MSNPITDEMMQAMIRMHGDGSTQREIADVLGVSAATVCRRLAKWKSENESNFDRVPDTQDHTNREAAGRRDVSLRILSSSDLAAVATGETFAKADPLLAGSSGTLNPSDELPGWADFGLDRRSWSDYTERMNLSRMVSMSPGMSRVAWDYTRLLDPGHEIRVFRPDSPDVIYDEAESVIQRFIRESIDPVHGSLTSMIQRVHTGLIYRGAVVSQLLVDQQHRPAGVLIPDPEIIRFKAREDNLYGQVWEPGVMIKGKWHSVESELFTYMPFDAEGTSPYGKSVIGASTFASFFITAMLWDIRRVTSQQGYTRQDISVASEMIAQNLPDNLTQEQKNDSVNSIIHGISQMVSRLEPDNTFVHTDAITVNRADGAIDGDVVEGITGLLEVLERMEIRALKTMPLLMGVSDGVSEANANRQWEIFVQGVKHLQHLSEAMLERVFRNVLQLSGYQADVEFRFAEARSAEVLRDEQSLAAKMENAAFAEDRGWISHEEAAEIAVGHEPTGEKSNQGGQSEAGDTGDTLDEPTDDGGPEDDGGGEDRTITKSDTDDLDSKGPTWTVTPNFASSAPLEPRRESMHELIGRRFFDHRKNIRAVDIGRVEIDHAINAWRRSWGDSPIATMLEAVPVDLPEQASESGWSWIRQTRTFVYKADQSYDSEDCRQLLGTYRERVERQIRQVARGVIPEGRELTTEEREEIDERSEIAWELLFLLYLIGSVMGRGGTYGLTSDDYEIMHTDITEENDFWLSLDSELHDSESMDDAESMMDWRWVLYLGGAYLLYETFRARSWGLDGSLPIPLHPNCFVPDTEVQAESIYGGQRRWYEGDIVRIHTRSGNVVSVTPNHPIATDKGWVKACDLDVSHKLVYARLGERGSFVDPEVDHSITSIGDLLDSLQLEVGSSRIVSARPDFHNDGMDGEVDISYANGKLWDCTDSLGLQEVSYDLFISSASRHLESKGLSSLSLLDKFLVRHDPASGSGVSSIGSNHSLLGGHIAHDDLSGLTASTDRDVVISEEVVDRASGDTEFVREGKAGLATDIEVNDSGLVDFFNVAKLLRDNGYGESGFTQSSSNDFGISLEAFSNSADRHALAVELDDLVGVDVVAYRGHVCNLSTVSGWYIAGGIVAHNCDCFGEYGEDDEGPFATWIIDGDMCPACEELAGDYQRWRGN